VHVRTNGRTVRRTNEGTCANLFSPTICVGGIKNNNACHENKQENNVNYPNKQAEKNSQTKMKNTISCHC